MKKIIITICILIFTVIIYFNMREGEASLGDNYYYLSVFEAMDCGYPGGAIIYKSPEENLFSNIKIRGDVTSVSHNDDYIIAIQQAKDSSDFKPVKSYNNNNNNNTILNYFIIAKKSDRLFGPFKKKEYLSKRNELGVPKELELMEPATIK